MKYLTYTLLALLALLTGCASSGFATATVDNTSRVKHFQDSILLQAESDLTAINDCYLRASGYLRVGAAAGALQKVGEPESSAPCTVMAMGLRTQSNMMTLMSPYVGQALMGRVPAAPEEIVADLAKFGVKAALLKFGVDRVSGVITSGQAAQAQIAQAGIAAASKPPLVVELPPPAVLAVPEGTVPVPLVP